MAEAFGVVTGALTVIQISKQVVSACYQYYRSAKAAKQEILNVINVVGGLQTTLDNLRLLDNPSDLPNVNGLEASIKACHSTLQKLATELGVDVTQSVDPDIRVKLNLPQRLFWPWKEKEVEKLLEVIERHKATFILALGADTLRATRAIRNGVSEITESVRTIAIDQRTEQKKDEKHKILTWLKASDPSLNHLAARKKHEPTTGNWFLQSKTFSRWTQGSVKSVWLYGIPGAGKTVLCSTVIEQVNELCAVKSRHQLAYYYFDFSDRDKQTFVGILRSMITQLCVGMDEAPDELIKLYHQCGDGTKQPRKESLIETFISAMAWTNRTYVIMDALDECAEQEELLTFLSQLLDKDFTPFDVRVLVTSRKEHCITEELGHSIDTRINLEGQGIDHDIEVYVLKRVERDKSLRKWPDAIQLEIRDALVNGAHGMF
jgi:DNA replication protein DnaC